MKLRAVKAITRELMLSVCLTFTLGSAALAVDADSTLGKLEQHFFQHTYAKDTVEARLNRLEKMIYGEAKQGAEQQRLSNLVQSVPAETLTANANNDNESSSNNAGQSRNNNQSSLREAGTPRRSQQASAPATSYPRETVPASKYPAVSAIEQKVLGSDYSSEPVEQRLARLEKKLFGQPSNNTDLSERVDRLKQRSGVDLAAKPPPGTDWDEDDDLPPNTSPTVARQHTYGGYGEDGKSFSGRDLRKDFQNFSQSFGSSSSGGGAYGMGGGSSISSGGSGAYGFGGGSAASNHRPAYSPVPESAAGMGLNQQVTALENEIFRRTYQKDPLPDRLNRLESTVFPNEKPSLERSLPDRVRRLASVVTISNQQPPKKLAQRPRDPDFPELDDNDLPPVAPQRSGLSKIINSIGNMIGGGSGYVGSYPTQSRLITDPQTGLLMDPLSGNLIDPTTGMVVGRRVAPPAMTPGYPVYGAPVQRMPSFNNGFSSSFGGFGMRPGINFGFGGGGMGVGPGFGMWP